MADKPKTFTEVVSVFEEVSNALYSSLNMTREEQLAAMEAATARIRVASNEEDVCHRRMMKSLDAVANIGKKQAE